MENVLSDGNPLLPNFYDPSAQLDELYPEFPQIASTSINPAPPGEGAAGGFSRNPPEVDKALMAMFHSFSVTPTIHRIRGVDNRNTFAFLSGDLMFFVSWHDYIPEESPVQ